MKSISLLFGCSSLLFALALGGCSSNDLTAKGAGLGAAGDTCVAAADCGTGLECDNGVCKAHHGDDQDEQGDDDDAGEHTGVACDVDVDCAAGEVCDDGFCKVDDRGEDHDDDGAGDDDGSGGGGDDSGGDDGDHGGESDG